MDLRSLINKLDAIEQAKLLLESEELLEKVGLRLDDYTSAVRGITNADERAAKIGEFARQYNFAGLFDPITGKFVNADGKFAWFGGYESEVKQLAAKGLIPDAAKTTAVLGAMGQDEKVAKPTSQSAEALYKQIDKSDELIKKALAESVTMSSSVLEGKGIADSLLAEFGLNTTILEAITPEEHQLIKKTRTDIEPLLKSGDGDAVEYRANYDNYIRERDRLIARIKEIIAAIKPAAAPVVRGGSSTSESVSSDYKKPIFELRATKPGITIHKPNFLGYLSPEKAKHNADMLRAGNAELEASDHVNQNVADLANGVTFGFADKAAAYLDSVATGTKYDDQLAKYKGGTDAYNKNKDAGNLRNLAGAMGYEIDKDNPFGNITPGDIGSLFTGAGLWKAGAMGVAKLGAGKGAQTAAGLTTGVVAPVTAALTIGNTAQAQTAAKDMDASTIKAMQADLVKAKANLGKFGPDKNGVDGKLGKLTLAAMADPKYSDIVQKYIKPSSKPAASSAPAPAPAAAASSAPAAAAPAPAPAASSAAPAPAPAASSAAPAPAAASATIRSDGSNGAYPSRAAPDALASFVPDPSVTPQVVKAALAKVGVTGNSITPEQLLALATSLGISEVAESTELDRIRKLSGMKEDQNLEEGGFDRILPWVITKLANSGDSETARLANMVVQRGMSAAEVQQIKAAKAIAKRIQDAGPSAADNAAPAAARAADTAASGADNVAPAAARAASGADNAAGGVANAADTAAAAGANVAGDAASAAANVADNVVPAASRSLLYKTTYALGKLGGKFTRLVKNNKFLSLLAALAALGVAVYLLGQDSDDTTTDKPNAPVQPQPAPVPAPAPDPKEEERKRQLAELEKLLARLNDGWPTDPETAEAIKAAVAIGAKAPAGAVASTGAVNTQPAAASAAASAAPRIDPRTGMDMNRFK